MPHLITRSFIFALACCAAGQAGAHGGGLNSEGCHNNRKTGDYHCHRAPARVAPARPLPIAARVDDNRAVAQQVPVANGATRPQCFTGPRGGTYTITASGRKNYSGC